MAGPERELRARAMPGPLDWDGGAGAPTRVTVPTGRVSRTFAWTVIRLRYLIVLAWAVAAVAAWEFLPGITAVQGGPIQDLIPNDAPALRAEFRSLQLFKVPVLARTVVVQRNPKGIPLDAQARAAARAVAVDQHAVPELRDIAGAIPVTNTLGVLPGSKENGTTILTYLFFRDGGLPTQYDLSHRYAAQINDPDDALVGVTGTVPARYEESNLIEHALPVVELATVLMIALLLGLTFRAPGPPLITLTAAGLAFFLSGRVLAAAGQHYGVSVPDDVRPVIVVLLLGITTDYSIFFLTGVRDQLRAGRSRLDAAKDTTALFVPIVFTAGLTVAAGSMALVVATQAFLRGFGPALALTVGVSLLVAITFVPALLAIFGRAVYWPAGPGRERASLEGSRAGWRARATRALTIRPVAAVVTLVAVAMLCVAAYGLRGGRFGFNVIGGLPPDAKAKVAADAAEKEFAPGILAPTEVLAEQPGIGDQRDRLDRLQQIISTQPGVAGIIGPVQEPRGQAPLGLAISDNGNAARFVVIMANDPLGGFAVDQLSALEDRMPELARQAGLGEARVSYAGDTALILNTIDRTVIDFRRIALVTILIDLVLLSVFLRSLTAPFFLLAASVLALLATLGITTFFFQHVLGLDDVTYYVPVAGAVLLVSLGSDYNIFVVGRIYEEARRLPLRDAITEGAARATRAIAIAGMAMAASFALLALVPTVPFRELAFAMFVGILVDSFLVRSILVPALIGLFGRATLWPSKRAYHEAPLAAQPAASTAA